MRMLETMSVSNCNPDASARPPYTHCIAEAAYNGSHAGAAADASRHDTARHPCWGCAAGSTRAASNGLGMPDRQALHAVSRR